MRDAVSRTPGGNVNMFELDLLLTPNCWPLTACAFAWPLAILPLPAAPH